MKNIQEIKQKFMYEIAEDITPPEANQIDDKAGENEKTTAADTDNKEPEKIENKLKSNPEENAAELTKEIDGLKLEVERLTGIETEKATLEQKVTDLQKEIDNLKNNEGTKDGVVKEYEDILNGMVNAQMEAIPENMRELVPENMSLKEKMAWLSKANELGLFKQADKNVEIGKPLNPNNSKQNIDITTASPNSLLSMAYGNSIVRKR